MMVRVSSTPGNTNQYVDLVWSMYTLTEKLFLDDNGKRNRVGRRLLGTRSWSCRPVSRRDRATQRRTQACLSTSRQRPVLCQPPQTHSACQSADNARAPLSSGTGFNSVGPSLPIYREWWPLRSAPRSPLLSQRLTKDGNRRQWEGLPAGIEYEHRWR